MLKIVLITEVEGGGVHWRERPSMCVSSYTEKSQHSNLTCKKTNLCSSPNRRERKDEGKTRALTGAWEETNVWLGRLEHRVCVLLRGPSILHFAFHASCCICASMNCRNGLIPHCLNDSLKRLQCLGFESMVFQGAEPKQSRKSGPSE